MGESSSPTLSSSDSESTTTSSKKRKMTRKRVRVRTRAPHLSNFNRCLICLGTCTLSTSVSGGKLEDDEGEGGTNLNIPGAQKSRILSGHLEQVFILRRLLELPVIWCEETLQKHTEKVLQQDQDKVKGTDKEEKIGSSRRNGDDVIGDLNLWFNFCEKCSKRWVQPGWEIYQKILDLEGQLNSIRATVKETMKARILQNKRNSKWSGLTGNGMAVQVRKWMFPDSILMKAEEEEEEEVKIVEPRPRRSCKTEQEFTSDLDDDDAQEDDDFNSDYDPGGLDQDFPSPPSSHSPPVKVKSPTSKKSKSGSKSSGPRKRIRKPKRKFEDLKKFKCSLCSSYFLKYEDLTKHLTLHESPEKCHVCPQCTFPAETSLDLQFHIKNRHERKKVRKCTWATCSFTCKSYVKLDKHLMEVHQEGDTSVVEAFNCEKCGRTFSKREALAIHQKKTHPELFGAELEEPVECDECGVKFLSNILLGYHVERVHRSEGPLRYQCDECGKGFNCKSKMSRHLIKHENMTKRDFVCDICGVDYAYKNLLDEHLRKVHGGGGGEMGGGNEEKVFSCKFCEMTSPFKVVIDRHLEEHKKEMGHKCGQCGKCYVSRQGLRRHERLNHPKEKIIVECPWCRKGFPSREYMRVHERLYCKLKGKGDSGTSSVEVGVWEDMAEDVKLNLC